MAEASEFTPDWTLQPRDKIAVALTLALTRHVSGWNGATDEELSAVAGDLLANVLPPVAGDYAGLVERLRNVRRLDPGGTELLREPWAIEAAKAITALDANVTLLGASLTSMQRDIDRLETDNARLREAISDTIQMIREWARENGFPVENSACFHRLSSALTTAPSGQEGEGQ